MAVDQSHTMGSITLFSFMYKFYHHFPFYSAFAFMIEMLCIIPVYFQNKFVFEENLFHQIENPVKFNTFIQIRNNGALSPWLVGWSFWSLSVYMFQNCDVEKTR